MSKLKSKVLAVLAGLVAISGAAFAANTFYTGYNPQTNQWGLPGLNVAGGAPLPVVTGSAGCGVLTAQVGGVSTGSVTIGTFATTCAITVTLAAPTIVVSSGLNDGKNAVNSAAAPNGLVCTFFDKTTQIVIVSAVGATTTACSSVTNTGMVTGDVIQFRVEAY